MNINKQFLLLVIVGQLIFNIGVMFHLLTIDETEQSFNKVLDAQERFNNAVYEILVPAPAVSQAAKEGAV